MCSWINTINVITKCKSKFSLDADYSWCGYNITNSQSYILSWPCITKASCKGYWIQSLELCKYNTLHGPCTEKTICTPTLRKHSRVDFLELNSKETVSQSASTETLITCRYWSLSSPQNGYLVVCICCNLNFVDYYRICQ